MATLIGTFSHWVLETEGRQYEFTNPAEFDVLKANHEGVKNFFTVFKDTNGREHLQPSYIPSMIPGSAAYKYENGRWEIGVPLFHVDESIPIQ